MTQEQFDELLPNRDNNHGGYQLIISRLNFGFLIDYGCKKLAIESTDKLQELINLYLTEPNTLYNLWHNSPEKEVMIQYGNMPCNQEVMVDASN